MTRRIRKQDYESLAAFRYALRQFLHFSEEAFHLLLAGGVGVLGGLANLAFYAFDLLVDRGEDIRKLPNIERKERLAALLEGVSPPILYGDHIIGRGEEMFEAVCKQGGEGIISKKASAPYSGTRTRNWLKIKCIRQQEFVVGGYTDPTGSRQAFGRIVSRKMSRFTMTDHIPYSRNISCHNWKSKHHSLYQYFRISFHY